MQNAAVPPLHKSAPKRKGHGMCSRQSSNCLLDALQATMLLAKAQKQLPLAPCCQGSCLRMNLLEVPVTGVGTAKDMTAIISSSQTFWDAASMITTGDLPGVWSEAAADGNRDAPQRASNAGKQYGLGATAPWKTVQGCHHPSSR